MKPIKKYDEAIERMNEEHRYIPELVDCDEVFQAYMKAVSTGRDLLDFDGPLWDHTLEGIVASMRNNGVTEFTVSSGYSNVTTTIGELLELGCTLNGMTMVASSRTEWCEEEDCVKPVMVYAFLLGL